MQRKRIVVGFGLGLAALAIAAGFLIVGRGGGGGPSAGNAVVRVTMDEYHMRLSTASAPAGKVTIVAVNKGIEEHEVVLLKTDKAANSLVVQSATKKVDEAAAGENFGEVEVEPGVTEAGTFNLSPGHYVFICNVEKHYKAGMFASFEVTGTPSKQAEKAPASKPAPAAAAATGEKKEVTLIKAVRPNLTNTLDALSKGDIPGAKKAFTAYDAAWNGVEVYINFRDRQLYADLETDLQAKIQNLLDAPQPNAAEIIPLVQAELAKWDEAIKLVQTGPPISPLFDDVAALRMLRADTIRAASPALKAGDVTTAKGLLSTFINKWPDIEDLIKERSPDAYAEIEGVMAKVNTAIHKDRPDAAELGPLVDTLTNRYNYGLSLVNAAARNADLTKTTFTKDDVQSAANLAAITAELKASLPLWQSGKYQDAGDHARRASGQLFASVSGVLKAKNGADAALQKALDAYTALSDKAGDANTVIAANKAAIEAVAVGEQVVVGQFWTDPKLKDAIASALKAQATR